MDLHYHRTEDGQVLLHAASEADWTWPVSLLHATGSSIRLDDGILSVPAGGQVTLAVSP
ncbi:hypothetical protein GCM10025857_23940 [Alicyclobacillus contaminans]|nr:hypothetical protein GCM10025857_23940 [Alicyclobacillus contaminans]